MGWSCRRESCVELGLFDVAIRVRGFDQAAAEVFEREAAAGFADGLFVFLRNPVLHAGEAAGDAGEHVFLGVAQRDGLEQLVEGDAGLLLHRPGVGLVLLADADGIDDDEVVFGRGVGRDGLEVVRLDDADAAALHLLEVVAGFDRAHEQHDFQRLDVGAGGDHVHGDGDARVVAVAEALEEVLRASPRWCDR